MSYLSGSRQVLMTSAVSEITDAGLFRRQQGLVDVGRRTRRRLVDIVRVDALSSARTDEIQAHSRISELTVRSRAVLNRVRDPNVGINRARNGHRRQRGAGAREDVWQH